MKCGFIFVSTKFVEHAFARGAAAVLVAGCHLNDCHYIDANYQTKKRIERLWKKMERLGLDKNRLHLAWISAAEGRKFAYKIEEMQGIVEKVPKDEIEKTVNALTPKEHKVGSINVFDNHENTMKAVGG